MKTKIQGYLGGTPVQASRRAALGGAQYLLRNTVVALVLALGLLSTKADAYHYYGGHWTPYHNHFYVGGVNLGWGLFGWPVVVGPYRYAYPVYGYSYWPYFGYQTYYASFGAIAYSKSTGEVGMSWSQSTRKRAEEDAVTYCGKEDCKPVLWVQGGCAALTKSEKTSAMGYAYYPDKYEAQLYAMRACKRSKAEDCKQLAWVCSY